MDGAPVFASAGEALDVAFAALGYLAGADAAGMAAEEAYASGQAGPDEVTHDELAFNLLDALAVEADPRVDRLLALIRERGWASWTRMEWTRLERPADRLGVSGQR